MAILRAELQGQGTVVQSRSDGGQLQAVCHGIFDGVAEAAADLGAVQTAHYAPGSLMYCLAEQAVYVKTSAGTWEAAV